MMRRLMAAVGSASTKVDPATFRGRSQQRYQRIVRTALSGIAAKAVSLAMGLVTVPVMLSYLGEDRFGLWMALTSLISMLTFTDLGLGVGLQNAISECDGKGDTHRPRTLLSSATLAALGMSLVLLTVAMVVLPHIPLGSLIKTHDKKAEAELIPTAQAMLLAVGFGLPFGLIQRVYTAYQKGYWGNIWLASGSVLAFGGVCLGVKLRLSLPAIAAIASGAVPLMLLAGGVHLFRRQPWLRPSLRHVSLVEVRTMLRTGIAALGAQISFSIVTAGPAIVIANRLGAAAVTPYSVTQRLLSVNSLLVAMAVLPLWPAYREATSRGDSAWVRSTFFRSLWLTTAASLGSFLVVGVLGQGVIRVWLGRPEAVPNLSLLMACNVCGLLMAYNFALGTLLNGLNRLWGQATYGLVLSIGALAAGCFAAERYKAAGIVWCIAILGWFLRDVFQAIEAYIAVKRGTCTEPMQAHSEEIPSA